MSLVIHYWIGDVQDCQGVSASEMTYIVSSGALNSTHSLMCGAQPPVFGALLSYCVEFTSARQVAPTGIFPVELRIFLDWILLSWRIRKNQHLFGARAVPPTKPSRTPKVYAVPPLRNPALAPYAKLQRRGFTQIWYLTRQFTKHFNKCFPPYKPTYLDKYDKCLKTV